MHYKTFLIGHNFVILSQNNILLVKIVECLASFRLVCLVFTFFLSVQDIVPGIPVFRGAGPAIITVTHSNVCICLSPAF